jgi:hypothetical protein
MRTLAAIVLAIAVSSAYAQSDRMQDTMKKANAQAAKKDAAKKGLPKKQTVIQKAKAEAAAKKKQGEPKK